MKILYNCPDANVKLCFRGNSKGGDRQQQQQCRNTTHQLIFRSGMINISCLHVCTSGTIGLPRAHFSLPQKLSSSGLCRAMTILYTPDAARSQTSLQRRQSRRCSCEWRLHVLKTRTALLDLHALGSVPAEHASVSEKLVGKRNEEYINHLSRSCCSLATSRSFFSSFSYFFSSSFSSTSAVHGDLP